MIRSAENVIIYGPLRMCQKYQISRYSVEQFSSSFMLKDRRRDKQAERFCKEQNRVGKQGRKKEEEN
jgi:hypothetical protein